MQRYLTLAITNSTDAGLASNSAIKQACSLGAAAVYALVAIAAELTELSRLKRIEMGWALEKPKASETYSHFEHLWKVTPGSGYSATAVTPIGTPGGEGS